MDKQRERDRKRCGAGRRACGRQKAQFGEIRGLGVSGIPWGGGRGQCRGGERTAPGSQEGRNGSTLRSLVEELTGKVEALEHRLAGTAQNHEDTHEP